ncbi:D-threo-aldose 1-dehydrogenase [Microlunatus sagamiharensis]|uniref:D-threo-aldose 1-dehydrogenase n=1 Tax=Microlunatus sagamiharensis TaxID=546874 RepID=A0A1H2MFE8_9ACTN|nr:aldo/keto reductase [Microlunatus sagamiharensis]SDU91765.1 D-threo-aldose 1-dehydrogenase [Microlunatus sagamiharensis]
MDEAQEMPVRRLRTGLALTEVGFGGAQLGNLPTALDDDVAQAAIDAAWDHGIRYFDTAPHYGLGLSERRLGDALAGRPRDAFAVSTKVGRLLVPTPGRAGERDPEFDVPATHERVRDYSRDGVLRSLEGSLERLGLDHVDIVYVHDPDDEYAEVAFTEAIPALVELRDQGVVGAVGVGMKHPEVPAEAIRRTDLDVVMVAGRYTVLEQQSAAELLPLALERGVGYVAAGVFGSGLLSRPRPTPDLTYDHGPVPPGLLSRVHALADLAERHGVTLPDVAAQFPLRHPAVVSVPLGVRTAEEVAQNAVRCAVAVPEELWVELEALPGQSGRTAG